MVSEGALTSVLSEFARTLTTDFPIQGILDHLVRRIVDVLPVSSAGVTLITDQLAPHYIAASDDSALHYERLQTEVGEGPCLTAYTSGAIVEVPDLAQDPRFPVYGPLAVQAGLAAVWTFPLRHGDGRLGALDLFRDQTGDLGPADLAAAQTLADVTAAYLLNAQARAEARAASDGHHHRSLHDPLTGLPNRVLLEQRLQHLAQRAMRCPTVAAVLFADLDRFKAVNDTYGHGTGDQLLQAVAQRLTHLVRPGDTLARVSGDEFVFLCEDLTDAGDAAGLARRIQHAFSAPFVLGELEVEMSASVGLAFAGRGEAVSPQLLVDADVAMYRAKRAGRGRLEVADPPRPGGPDRVGLMTELRDAFASGRLQVHYQPVVTLPGCQVQGVEALLRWDHPTRGQVPACEMIAVAEESGLIHALGAWVLERACRDQARWADEHPHHPLDVAVNVSGRQLRRAGFVDSVLAVLHQAGADPAALVLEVTEGVLVEDSPVVVEVFTRLRSRGVRLALDDFGTGWSSLGYLRRLPVDVIKVDRTFVVDLGSDPVSDAMVATITQLAHVLGLTVVAEGVETEAQLTALRGIGCEAAQGFLLSRPVTADAIGGLLSGAGQLRPRLPRGAPAAVLVR